MNVGNVENTETVVGVAVGLALVQVYEFTDADTGTTHFWNATEGRRLAEARNAEALMVDLRAARITRETLRILAPDVDRNKALALPAKALLSPLLFVPHRGKHVCIDGWHRITKAVYQNVPQLPALLLTEQEAEAIRVADSLGNLL